MPILITIASILLITAIAWLMRRFATVKICPICAGVAGTWLWMLLGLAVGGLPLADYQLPIAILMGGSVVGIAYQVDKRLPGERSPLLWKLIFIPIGFFAVYNAVVMNWFIAAGAAITSAILGWWFLQAPKSKEKQNKKVEELEKKMEKCC